MAIVGGASKHRLEAQSFAESGKMKQAWPPRERTETQALMHQTVRARPLNGDEAAALNESCSSFSVPAREVAHEGLMAR